MKTSTFTGQFIYNRIKSLKTEVDEINNAKGEILDGYGKDSSTYRILEKAYKEKQSELDRYFVEVFETHSPKGFDF